MQEGWNNKKLLWPGLGLGLIVLAVLVFLGPRAATSYYFERGYDYFERGDYTRAEANFSRSLFFNSKNSLSHAALGRLALGKENSGGKEYYPEANWAAAIPHYEKALELGFKEDYPGPGFYAHTLEHLGHSYLNTGQYEKAKEMYLLKIERFGNHPFNTTHFSTLWPRFLTAEMDFGRFNNPLEARELLEPLDDLTGIASPNIYRIHTLRSRIYLFFGDYNNAEKYAKLAVETAGENNNSFDVMVAHDVLALVEGKRGNFSDAEAEIKKAEELTGKSGSHQCILALAYLYGKNYSKAVSVAKGAAAYPSDYVKSICLNVLGSSYEALGKKPEAKNYFRAYLDLTDTFDPKNIIVIRDREEFKKKLDSL